MHKKRIMFVGPSMSGKTTLSQRITNQKIQYQKTQTTNIVDGFIVDTPGEYLERVNRRCALTVVASDVDMIIFVQDATCDRSDFPPSYSSLFGGKEIIGIVTKIDIADAKSVERAMKFLALAGVKKIFKVSSVTGEGIDSVLEAIG